MSCNGRYEPFDSLDSQSTRARVAHCLDLGWLSNESLMNRFGTTVERMEVLLRRLRRVVSLFFGGTRAYHQQMLAATSWFPSWYLQLHPF